MCKLHLPESKRPGELLNFTGDNCVLNLNLAGTKVNTERERENSNGWMDANLPPSFLQLVAKSSESV